MTTHLSTNVSLFMRGIKLPNRDRFSKNDCFAVVYIKSKAVNDNQPGNWEEIYRTSTITDNNNPQWAEAAVVESHFEELQEIKFEIYDRDSKSEKLKKHDFIGYAETTMSKIMGSRGCTFSCMLKNKKGREGKNGKFVVVGQEVAETKDLVQFQFEGAKLERKNLMGLGRSDPFYLICQQQPDGTFVRVFESEVIKSTVKPKWKPQTVPLQVLCNGIHDRALRIDVFDWESSGDHKFIGCATTSVQELMKKKELNLINIHVRKNKKSSGTLIVKKFNLLPRHGFLKYIEGGCELKLSVAIDFTGSNGHPADDGSLHYMPPNFYFQEGNCEVQKMNEYQKAILAVGQILQDYDSDQMIPVYGFGAHFKEDFNMHCFPLTMDAEHDEVHKVGGIMQAYSNALARVDLSGPTYFSHILRKTVDDCEEVYQEKQSYNILLIITDGVINDMSETIDRVIEGSHKALSIIIVGVGNADFENMELLDCDDENIRLHQSGKTALRDIVQFVPFRKFQKMSYTALAEEVLREIPDQMEDFFRRKGIVPNKKRPASARHFEIAEAEVVVGETDEDDTEIPLAKAEM